MSLVLFVATSRTAGSQNELNFENRIRKADSDTQDQSRQSYMSEVGQSWTRSSSAGETIDTWLHLLLSKSSSKYF
jgi:hypothetical protein